MTIDAVQNKVHTLAVEIARKWSQTKEFNAGVVGTAIEIVATKRDFKDNYNKFDLFVGDQLTRMQGVLLVKFGMKDERKITMDWVRTGRKLITSSYPTGMLNDKDVLNAAYRANEFLLRYIACGEKSRFGESMLLCYPICGIPCNWDESMGVLSVFHANFTQA